MRRANAATRQADTHQVVGPARRSRDGKALVWLLLVLLLVVALLGAIAWLAGGRLPELTRERFDAAQQQWEANAPVDYEIAVQVVGNQPAVYRVVVRAGQVESAMRDGAPLRGERTLGTWSVPGMFRTIEIDLEAQEQAAADGKEGNLILWCEFDPQHGYPARYRRVQWGNHQEASWEVLQFRHLEKGSAGSAK